MTRKRKSPISNFGSLTTRQMRQRKPINRELLDEVHPLTDTQREFFHAYESGKCVVSYGSAGTGKTYVTLYNALKEVLDERTPYEKVYIVRSLVPTREIGFLPGSHDDKADLYQIPYKNMVQTMFYMESDQEFEMLYGKLKEQETIKFWSTSFIRGTTLDNCIVIVDEFQNLSFHESCSIITRIGTDAKIMFCGDTNQSDLTRESERNGVLKFLQIMQRMESVDMIEYTVDDIVRSDFVKEFLVAKEELGF